MSTNQWPADAGAMHHSPPDFDQSWTRKAPFHPHLQSAYGQRPALPNVYPNQGSDHAPSPQRAEHCPSNYDYPDGSHLFHEAQDPRSIHRQWNHQVAHRLYENCHPREVHLQEIHRLYPDHPQMHKQGMQHAVEDHIRYDMPVQSRSHHVQLDEEVVSRHQHQPSERSFTSTQQHHVTEDYEGPVAVGNQLTASVVAAYDYEMTVNGRPIRHMAELVDQQPPKHSVQNPKPREVKCTFNVINEDADERSMEFRQAHHNKPTRTVPRLKNEVSPEEANHRRGEMVQATTNPFMNSNEEGMQNSNSCWAPKRKVQSVVQMINQRNEPVNGFNTSQRSQNRNSLILQNAEEFDHRNQEESGCKKSSSFVDCHKMGTIDRSTTQTDHQGSGILKRQSGQEAHVTIVATSGPAKAIPNPPPAPPLPEGFFKRLQSTQKHPKPKCRDSTSEYSNSSTISTDSAMASDNSAVTISISNSVPRRDVSSEADLLLLYFKQHATVLKFIGIQLPKGLLTHIERLPDKPKVRLVVEVQKATNQTPSAEADSVPKSRTNKDKMARRASSKKGEKKAKRLPGTHPHANSRKASEEVVSVAEQTLTSGKQAPLSVGNTIISISQGPYPGYPDEQQIMQNESEIRQKLLEIRKQEMIDDFDDVSRQMVSREASLSISSDGKQTMSSRSGDSAKRGTLSSDVSDGVFMDDDELSVEARKRRNETSPLTEAQRAESRSGRFVKKSAAALIARKQTSRNNSPSPGNNYNTKSKTAHKKKTDSKPTEHRIAAEIANLREREDELRRNRHQLGLPTLEDIVDIWRQGQGGYGRPPISGNGGGGANVHHEQVPMDCMGIGAPLRSARSFDHLHFEANEATHRGGARVAKSESFHHLQVENNVDKHVHEPRERYGREQMSKHQNSMTPERMGSEMQSRNGFQVNSSSKRHNFEYPNVQINVRSGGNVISEESGTLERRIFESHENARLRRHYHEEYPAVRL